VTPVVERHRTAAIPPPLATAETVPLRHLEERTMTMSVLLTCGHMSAMRESGHPDALLWCETCNSWQERDESNGLCLEDLP
jgi:hypothetical protein